jgi:2-polyprenyl-3-methyl-5-hydroxy-6-metoxy-1,4-benzoquinol methylase
MMESINAKAPGLITSKDTNMQDSLAADYASKNEDYYNFPRPEMYKFLPASYRTLLDVGCGRGAFGAFIRKQTKCEVWGVEPDAECLPQAQTNLDKVLHGCFVPGMELPLNYFDCIVFNDVLEHMLDPVSALQFAASLLSKNGVIMASIPNIGHFPTVWKLIVRGDWDYQERGILDKTHLRFYTRNSIRKLFEKAGFELQTLKGINPFLSMEPGDSKLWRRYRLCSWMPICGVRDMRYLQFAAVAKTKG